MGKKKDKIKESAEIKVHKLEIEKLELKDKLKKEKSEKAGLIVCLSIIGFLSLLFLIAKI